MSHILRRQLDAQGYIVVPQVVPRENVEAVAADVWQHTGADPANTTTWYNPATISPDGMVEMYHYQSMWDTRQLPRVHQVFAELFGTEKLWVSLDRTNFKPPAHPDYPPFDHRGFIHWDTDIARFPHIPFGVQGVLALTDTDEDMGGFQCVPELYQELGTWLARQPAETRASRRPDLTGYHITRVPLRAGDMVIWRTTLPHGNGHNQSSRPRLAQYITMYQADGQDERERLQRITCWRENIPPPRKFFPGDSRKIEEQRSQPAQLTALGKKLLGLESWPETS